MGEQRRWSDTDRELVAGVLHQEGCEDPCPGNCANDAAAVLDALTAAGWRPAVGAAGAALDEFLALRDARIRAQAGEDAARAIEDDPGNECTCRLTDTINTEAAARLVREVTGSTEPTP